MQSAPVQPPLHLHSGAASSTSQYWWLLQLQIGVEQSAPLHPVLHTHCGAPAVATHEPRMPLQLLSAAHDGTLKSFCRRQREGVSEYRTPT